MKASLLSSTVRLSLLNFIEKDSKGRVNFFDYRIPCPQWLSVLMHGYVHYSCY